LYVHVVMHAVVCVGKYYCRFGLTTDWVLTNSPSTQNAHFSFPSQGGAKVFGSIVDLIQYHTHTQ